MTAQDAGPKRKAPRSSSTKFADLVRAYTKHPVPDYLLIDKSEWLGDEDIEVDRYITREYHELEKEKIWKKIWQMACREEEIPEVGDTITYEICDLSFLIVRTGAEEFKAFYNVCLHQGRLLRDPGPHGIAGVSRNSEFRCPFHGFCWGLNGELMHIPSQWDFPQIDTEQFDLREVRVGRWGGFVFINPDPDCESLESFMGDMPRFWEKFPLEERYTAAHVAKVLPANWKTTQEAFMEGFHINSTHPQFAVFPGVATDADQYDAFGNYARALGQGGFDIPIGFWPTAEERLATVSFVGHPEAYAGIRDHGPVEDIVEQFEVHRSIKREVLRKHIGDKVDALTDFEVDGGGYFNLFPNFHPWWSYSEITYRFRPHADDPERCLMEVYLLRPFRGERPKPAPIRWLSLEESFLEAPELGFLAQIFHQDEFNIPSVQRGLHNLKALGRGIVLNVYQGTKIRHFHKLWDEWVLGRPFVRHE